MNSYNFTEMKKIGKWAVDRLTEHWLSMGFQVRNVEEDKFYQTLDIDLVLDGPSKQTYVEVKGDRYTTGNIYIETVGNAEEGTPGCLVYTGADYIAYYLVKSGKAIMIPVPGLKKWITENIHKYDEKKVRSHFDSGSTFTSRGRPVPMIDILHEVPGTMLLAELPLYEE